MGHPLSCSTQSDLRRPSTGTLAHSLSTREHDRTHTQTNRQTGKHTNRQADNRHTLQDSTTCVTGAVEGFKTWKQGLHRRLAHIDQCFVHDWGTFKSMDSAHMRNGEAMHVGCAVKRSDPNKQAKGNICSPNCCFHGTPSRKAISRI